MTLQEFKSTLMQSDPPAHLHKLLIALWHDANGNWDTAHNVAQDIPTAEGSWIHAYLHRKEGDLGNASYWYHRANRKIPAFSLEKEWEEIATELLSSL